MIPHFTAYVEDEASLKCFVSLGYKKLLIEHPRFSLLCKGSNQDQFQNNYIESIFDTAKAANPKLSIVFNLDLLAHQQDLKDIHILLEKLSQVGYDGVRVQDLGLATLILNDFPQLSIEIQSNTRYTNAKSIAFLENGFSPSLKSILLSKDLPYSDLSSIISQSVINFELQVHGPLLLFHSRRKLLAESDFFSQSSANQWHALYLQEKKRPNQWFKFIDNPHGSFMFFCQDLSLINHVDKLLDLNLSHWLLDFRGQSIEIITKVSEAFKEQCEAFQNGNPPYANEQLNAYYPQGLTEGFFLNNPTDSHAKPRDEKDLTLLGKVITVVKEKKIAVEVYNDFQQGESLIIKTPHDKEISFTPIEMLNMNYEQIHTANKESLVILNWKKSISAESLIYRYNQ